MGFEFLCALVTGSATSRINVEEIYRRKTVDISCEIGLEFRLLFLILFRVDRGFFIFSFSHKLAFFFITFL